MRTLFGGTQARAEETWTPSSGSFSEDLNSSSPSPSIAGIQVYEQQERNDEIETEELTTNIRRKPPCPSQNRNDVKNAKFNETFELLVTVVEEEKNQGPTIAECIAFLR